MQIYLHISNIFCTFVADLGIVPSATIIYKQFMNITTLCRVNVGGKTFRLCGLFRDGSKVAYAYRIYLGRRRWEPCDYPTIDYALRVMQGQIESRILRILTSK